MAHRVSELQLNTTANGHPHACITRFPRVAPRGMPLRTGPWGAYTRLRDVGQRYSLICHGPQNSKSIARAASTPPEYARKLLRVAEEGGARGRAAESECEQRRVMLRGTSTTPRLAVSISVAAARRLCAVPQACMSTTLVKAQISRRLTHSRCPPPDSPCSGYRISFSSGPHGDRSLQSPPHSGRPDSTC